jgi:hypothetical protein
VRAHLQRLPSNISCHPGLWEGVDTVVVVPGNLSIGALNLGWGSGVEGVRPVSEDGVTGEQIWYVGVRWGRVQPGMSRVKVGCVG